MTNYFDTTTHANYLREDVQNRSDLSTLQTIAQQIFLNTFTRGEIVYLDGWNDDADNVTKDGLVESVRITVGRLINWVADQNTNTAVTEVKQGERYWKYGSTKASKGLFDLMARYDTREILYYA